MTPPSRARTGSPRAVRVLAWGVSAQDVDQAVRRAGAGPSRRGWQFEHVERIESDACPLDVQDPKTIAADAGQGWAYAVYRAELGDG